MSAHTPGPWRVFEHSWSNTSIVAKGFDHGICGLDINHATEESQEADAEVMAANARLIAAAPEMLEALRDTLERIERSDAWWMDAPEIGGMDAERIRAAIAKATGEEA